MFSALMEGEAQKRFREEGFVNSLLESNSVGGSNQNARPRFKKWPKAVRKLSKLNRGLTVKSFGR